MAVDLAVRKRSEIPVDDTWDLSAIYDTTDEWEADIAKIREEVPRLTALKGKLGESADRLLHVTEIEERIGELLARVYAYAALKKDEDTADTEAQAAHDKVVVLSVEIRSKVAFIEPEILALPEGMIERFLEEEPRLEKYRHALEALLRNREHVLDTEAETLLASAGEIAMAPGMIFSMLNDADLRYGTIQDDEGNEVELTKANFSRFIESRNRDVRRAAWVGMHDAYLKHRNTTAASYAASVKKDVFFSRTRKYENVLESALFPANIPTSVYDTLITTINDHLPLLHRYIALRKRVLDLDKLGVHDLYVPIVPEVEDEYAYDEAVSIVLDGLKPLGGDYVDALGGGLKSRWVDVYENEGKRSGAYSMSVYGVHPYILMNWSGNLREVFTLAHEAGHAMHSFYTCARQPFVYGHYTIFVAEVASTVNEILLTDAMRRHTDEPNVEMYLINHALEDFRGTLFRQTMFAEFERWTHSQVESGQALTADFLSTHYAELCERYYGPDVEVDEYVAIEWARVPHFYRAFYVYQYATGISAAAALASQILEEGEPAGERYRRFLSSGSSQYSLDILNGAGVDMTTPEPIEGALAMFAGWLDELETLLDAGGSNGYSRQTGSYSQSP